jgi:hypothetical protein
MLIQAVAPGPTYYPSPLMVHTYDPVPSTEAASVAAISHTGDPNVAGHGQLEPAPQRRALHHRQRRHGQVLHRRHEAPQARHEGRHLHSTDKAPH